MRLCGYAGHAGDGESVGMLGDAGFEEVVEGERVGGIGTFHVDIVAVQFRSGGDFR